ncbi:hypothetical protein MIDIC_420010 [Alphaproteobacteria bacterium]
MLYSFALTIAVISEKCCITNKFFRYRRVACFALDQYNRQENKYSSTLIFLGQIAVGAK